VNPRASRTIPFVSKAIGVPLAKLAAKVMVGRSLQELGFTKEIVPKHFSVKEAVFPFLRYEGLDISLGPEMKSTGEVMGIDVDLGLAYANRRWPRRLLYRNAEESSSASKTPIRKRSFPSRANISNWVLKLFPPAARQRR